MTNRRKHWSEADLNCLQDLLTHRTPMDDITRTLGRSEAAVRHAMTKLLFRSMVHYRADELFAFYNLAPQQASAYLVQDKYDRVPTIAPVAPPPTTYAEAEESAVCRGFCWATTWLIVGSIGTFAMLAMNSSVGAV